VVCWYVDGDAVSIIDAVGPKEPCVKRGGVQIPTCDGANLCGEKGPA